MTGKRLRDCQQLAKSLLQPHRASPAGRGGVVTSNRHFCTLHQAGLAAEIHAGVNIKLLGRYSVTSQSLSSALTRRPAVALGPHISSSGRRDSHAHPGTMSKQICDLASQPGRAGAVAPACSLRDNELSLRSCFFSETLWICSTGHARPWSGGLWTSSWIVGQLTGEGSRAKSRVVHFTETIQTPVKTVLPSKTSSSLAVQYPNVLPQGNAHLGDHQAAPQGRAFTARSLGSLQQSQ